MRYSFENRVRLQKDFDYIKKNAVKADCSAFILYMAHPQKPQEISRLGVVASKRIGNSVVRHHAKRIFREVFRNNPPTTPCDILIFVRRGYSKFEFQKLTEKFVKSVEFCAKKIEERLAHTPQAESKNIADEE